MSKFLLVYRGGRMPESPEEGAKVTAAWASWFAKLGDAVADGGNPASKSRTIAADGSVSATGQASVSGYSIISAESLDAATALAAGCPVLGGGASVEVVETFNAM